MQKWEYLTVTVDQDGFYLVRLGDLQTNAEWAHINQLGDQGWEAVSVQFDIGHANRKGVALFKRPKSEQAILFEDGMAHSFVTHQELEDATGAIVKGVKRTIADMTEAIVHAAVDV